ncbi:hypothetical protein AB0M48_35570 [Lentzea sp. NPDC051208]|uniref:hypothetical protein n=1 Tax=Lentzea sp. NPDC051208 TaxID=3154642 RepID=UPI0034331785
MLKKAFTAAAVGAGFLMMGTPALATEGGATEDMTDLAPEHDHDHQVALVDLKDAKLLGDITVCHVDVNVLAAPALSSNDAGPCVNPDIEGEHFHEDDSER